MFIVNVLSAIKLYMEKKNMINSLYNIFQHWSKTGSVYIISDTHFGDSDREYMGYNITEEEQIKILKKTIHRQDTLIHLGDVGNPTYFKDFPCYKVLIMGNHDQSKTKFKEKCTTIDLDDLNDEEIRLKEKNKEIDYWSFDFYRPFKRGYKSNNLFNEIYTGPLWIAEKLVLSHEPLNLQISIVSTPIAFNIHGHDHSQIEICDNFHLNLAQNVYGYEPLNLKKWIEKGYLKNILSVHRTTINYQTEKKNER